MRFLRPVLAVALLAGGAFVASEAKADKPSRPNMALTVREVEIKMQDFSFPSGMRIIFQEDHSQPVVQVTMKIDHGSQDDPQGLEGMAHLIEHLWFRSIHTDKAGKDLPKVMDLIKQMGAAFNATTSSDRTDYLTVARSGLTESLIRLEALRLRDAVRKVTAQDVLIEREVVRNELRLRMENGFGRAFEYLFDKVWPVGHPYHRETIGSHDSLNAITLADIQKYVKDYYTPSETTLVVAGDFQAGDVKNLLGNFGIDQLAAPDDPEGKNLALVAPKVRISGKPTDPPAPQTPIEIKGQVTNLQTYSAAVEKRAVILGWSLPSSYTEQDAVADTAIRMLNISIRNELRPEWMEEDQAEALESTDIGCFGNGGRYGNTAFCFVEIGDDEDPAKIVESALNGVHTLWSRDETLTLVQRYVFSASKQGVMAAIFGSADEVTDLFAGRGAVVSDFVHFTGDPQYYSRQIQWNSKVTPDAVRAFAEKWLQRSRATAIVMEPYEDGDLTLDGSDSAYRGQSRDEGLLTLFNPDEVNEKLISDTIVIPDSTKLIQQTLPNGVKLVVMPHGSGTLVHMGVVFDGGPESIGMDRLPTEFGQNTYYSNVNGGMDPFKIGDVGPFDPLRIAGDLYRSDSALGTAIQASASAGNVADAAYLVRNQLDTLTVDSSGRLGWVKKSKKAILKWMKKAADTAPVVQRERLFPGHVYGTWLNHKDWDALDKMGNKDTEAYVSKVFRPKNATMFIVGNINAEDAVKAATTYMGGWEGYGKEPAGWTAPKREYPAPPPPPARQIILFNKDNASQTEVSYQCQLAPINEENEWSAAIMSDVISDALWLALREQTGASYGAYPYTQYLPGGVGIFGQAVSVQNDSTGFAVKTFIEQGEKAKAMKLDDRIVATQKFNNAQAYVLGQSSASKMFSRLVGTRNRGWSFDNYGKIASRIAKVSQKDFPALLERCVGHEVITAVGPLAIIKPQFEKLGMAVEVFDVDTYRKTYRETMGLKAEKEEKKKDEKKK